ncbi:UDP-N-acetylmuramoyl-tripeptide--D-alanyl-D-alanine ligase [Oenococcus oeni]|uniref:UDP-N-acetylmuramoyl-tripeptide--D-alanyl-D-alanine ligase n=1 Tax=Oenococcus oeni TaxID=1247 RepID=A0AAQ2UTZ5_OENOE|nr:UDP-N-acetylmuramoyl-tripeptide--D-alanyl-D-alanine ligase [Oenococcus oeni]KGI02332.1 UDP-N-acetylmuramoyl-tripeptide--D-alanyl-D-alanine ligase [Oenococcus oeni IOEB_C52]OIM22636.1 UDP-N-acetylmuramoyl-tripeptide--D-alanyl-D-alanine ligase [Oenococcus oeni]OIM24861.1 UDP-N-acetylmuramoyl-tripeptide--D-alanyl-D-alanine ligase [Oenococcus oeni]OLQ38913.1 UDP-N-acetylmuramoyl-tripeptide--D-alanyl-D-alanine ligase [Oenococcus oeni]SYW06405.1 UDP-N-acetylmuramoyl-tripeptide--D-alanyl-D-alanine
MHYSIAEICKIVDGKLINISNRQANETFVDSLDFDSRKIKQGALFLPISDHDNASVHKLFSDYTIAEKDGHKFINSALKNGAVASFADHIVQTSLPLILVSDTQLALWALAKNYLNKVNPKRIAVTGSNGKTTTKDLIASVLSRKYKVHRTVASNNNEIGVPTTILDMPADTEIAVIEMGMDHPGQLTALSKMLEPNIALITMIGEAHIEFFKTRDKIADAKMEIIKGLKKDGTFIYDGDEILLKERADLFSGEKVTFGEKESNNFWVSQIEDKKRLSFKVNQETYSVNLLGKFNADNCAAAVAVAKEFNLNSKTIQEGFDNLQITKNRLQLLTGSKGETIISDVYNSNPTAAIKAIEILKDFPTQGKKILVLGDMLELGYQEVSLHLALKAPIERAAFDEVYLVGPIMKSLAAKMQARWYDKAFLTDLSRDLQSSLSKNDVVLLKASHGIHLEKVERALI